MTFALVDRTTSGGVPLHGRLSGGTTIRRTLIALALVGLTHPARAQTAGGAGSLTTFIHNIANLLTGTLGQAIAILAVAIIGVSMSFGAFDMRRGGMAIFGVAVIFSAAWIVSQVTGSSLTP